MAKLQKYYRLEVDYLYCEIRHVEHQILKIVKHHKFCDFTLSSKLRDITIKYKGDKYFHCRIFKKGRR